MKLYHKEEPPMIEKPIPEQLHKKEPQMIEKPIPQQLHKEEPQMTKKQMLKQFQKFDQDSYNVLKLSLKGSNTIVAKNVS